MAKLMKKLLKKKNSLDLENKSFSNTGKSIEKKMSNLVKK